MKIRIYYISSFIISVIILLTLILALPFATPSEYCSKSENIKLSNENVYANDESLPFRFPVDDLTQDQLLGAFYSSYGYSSSSLNSKEYHAAEDYHQPAGSPVYALTEGNISFSGPMGGYGWLIIIDHPDLNLYSLYGHLSPSRWYIKSGSVQKGQLIAYLGDPDENGGNKKNPLTPHLHFGVRSGQRADYPSMGEWRWQAGWIKYCPLDLGWLQPSEIISKQDIPDAGFHNPETAFLATWWQEMLLSILILNGAITALFATTMRVNILLVIGYSITLPLLTWYTFNKGLLISYALIILLVIFIVIRIYKFFKRNQISNPNK
ncbi:M23 family metallopeptidase [Chloroflexota bacterium]